MEHPLPRPNAQALSWFYGEEKKGSLVLNPKYQRNPIWSLGQKCFLIDSLISGCPLPQVYINVKIRGKGAKRKTIYEVVDGQQRLNAILEFMADKWSLVTTAAKAYPVSGQYRRLIGKQYSKLRPELQDRIWNYPLVVQELRGWSDERIRDLFRRLNYVVEKLNNQELRHSQYFGEFVQTVENLTKLIFWDDIRLFSRRASARMRDVEFISELFVLVIGGPQDQQKTLDRFYADYDVSFPRKAKWLRRFNRVVSSLQTISDLISGSRLSKRADFYALFGAVADIVAERGTSVDLARAGSRLRRFVNLLDTPADELTGTASQYYQSVIEGPNKYTKRKTRIEIIRAILEKARI
jgi:hypothetical protein